MSIINRIRDHLAASIPLLPPALNSAGLTGEKEGSDTYFVKAVIGGCLVRLLSHCTEAEAVKVFNELEAFKVGGTEPPPVYIGITTTDGGEIIIVQEALGAFSYGIEQD